MKHILKTLKLISSKSLFLKSSLALTIFFLTFGLNFVFLKNQHRMKQLFEKKPENFSQIVVQLLNNDMKIRAITKKEQGVIKLKIFKVQTNGKAQLINDMDIGQYEAYFESGEDTISLGVLDYNGDGFMEIIVASFDKFFRPNVSILEYNRKKQSFEKLKITPDDLLRK